MSTQNKHTPGPWKAQSRCASDGTLVVKDASFDEICVVREKTLRDYTDEDKKHVANARLIAAAPDLLAACEAVLKADANPQPWLEPKYSNAIAQARSALSKARGE